MYDVLRTYELFIQNTTPYILFVSVLVYSKLFVSF